MGPWVAVIFCAARPLFGGEPLLDVEGHELRDEFLGRRRDVLPRGLVELVFGATHDEQLEEGVDNPLADLLERRPEQQHPSRQHLSLYSLGR